VQLFSVIVIATAVLWNILLGQFFGCVSSTEPISIGAAASVGAYI